MARANEDFLQKYEDSFECSVCLTLFDNPRNLPCGHALCGPPKDCLTSLLEKSARCPVCRKKFESKQVENFPINYPLMTAIETLKPKSENSIKGDEWSGGRRKFQICHEHKLEKEFYCRSCSICICKLCFVDHAEKSHVVTLFKQFIQESILLCEKEAADENIDDERVKEIEQVYQQLLDTLPALSEGITLLKNEKHESTCLKDKVLESTSKSELESSLSYYRVSITKAHDSLFALKLSSKDSLEIISKFTSSLDIDNGKKTKLPIGKVNEYLPTKLVPVDATRRVGSSKSSFHQDTSYRHRTLVGGTEKSLLPETVPYTFQTEVSSCFEVPDDINLYRNESLKAVYDHDGNVFVLCDESTILKVRTNLSSFKVLQTDKMKLESFNLFDIACSTKDLYGLKRQPIAAAFLNTNLEEEHELCLCRIDKTSLQIVETVDTSMIQVLVSSSRRDACIAGDNNHLYLFVNISKKLYIFKDKIMERTVTIHIQSFSVWEETRLCRMYAELDHLWLEYKKHDEKSEVNWYDCCVIGYKELEGEVKVLVNQCLNVKPFRCFSSPVHGIKGRSFYSVQERQRKFTIYPQFLGKCSKGNKVNTDRCQIIYDKDHIIPTFIKHIHFEILCNLTENVLLCYEYEFQYFHRFYLLKISGTKT